jgi:spore coat polysaccharide biosynthesis protein SpsF
MFLDMNAVVLLQARVSSSRLPAKVLLPISGMPVFELSLRRLGNTGLSVKLCTSTDSQDDLLHREASLRNFDIFRGSLTDVLGRFRMACAGLHDDTVVVRATSDNVFPDGRFVELLLEEFEANSCGYLYANGAESDLPDGLKVEIFRLRDLAAADRETSDPYDREHVTPWIIRKYGSRPSQQWAGRGWGSLRATIDTLGDYIRVSNAFFQAPRDDARSIGHEALCRYLAECSE